MAWLPYDQPRGKKVQWDSGERRTATAPNPFPTEPLGQAEPVPSAVSVPLRRSSRRTDGAEPQRILTRWVRMRALRRLGRCIGLHLAKGAFVWPRSLTPVGSSRENPITCARGSPPRPMGMASALCPIKERKRGHVPSGPAVVFLPRQRERETMWLLRCLTPTTSRDETIRQKRCGRGASRGHWRLSRSAGTSASSDLVSRWGR